MLEATRDKWSAHGFASPRRSSSPGDTPWLVAGYHGMERGRSDAYVDFDLQLDPGLRGRYLKSAHLELFALQADGGPAPVPISPYVAQAIRRPWGETDGLIPADIDREVTTSPQWVHPKPDAWLRFDVTSEVRRRLQGDASHGWRLRNAAPNQHFRVLLGSRESEWPPRLVLVFEDPERQPRIFLPWLQTLRQTRHFSFIDESNWPWSDSLDLEPLPDAPLALDLNIASRTIAPWNGLDLEARLRNQGEEAITIISPLEYSGLRYRMPLYQWELRRDGIPLRHHEHPGCGTTVDLATKHFVTLGPNASFDLMGPDVQYPPSPAHVWTEPGHYTLQLHYVLEKQGGQPASGLDEDWSRVLETTVPSERVPFTVALPQDRFGRRYPALRLVRVGWRAIAVEAVAGPPDNRSETSDERHRLIYYLEPAQPGQPDYLRPQFTFEVDVRTGRITAVRQRSG